MDPAPTSSTPLSAASVSAQKGASPPRRKCDRCRTRKLICDATDASGCSNCLRKKIYCPGVSDPELSSVQEKVPPPRPRQCDRCRRRKVKCDVTDTSGCSNCLRQKKRCPGASDPEQSSVQEVENLQESLLPLAEQRIEPLLAAIPAYGSLNIGSIDDHKRAQGQPRANVDHDNLTMSRSNNSHANENEKFFERSDGAHDNPATRLDMDDGMVKPQRRVDATALKMTPPEGRPVPIDNGRHRSKTGLTESMESKFKAMSQAQQPKMLSNLGEQDAYTTHSACLRLPGSFDRSTLPGSASGSQPCDDWKHAKVSPSQKANPTDFLSPAPASSTASEANDEEEWAFGTENIRHSPDPSTHPPDMKVSNAERPESWPEVRRASNPASSSSAVGRGDLVSTTKPIHTVKEYRELGLELSEGRSSLRSSAGATCPTKSSQCRRLEHLEDVIEELSELASRLVIEPEGMLESDSQDSKDESSVWHQVSNDFANGMGSSSKIPGWVTTITSNWPSEGSQNSSASSWHGSSTQSTSKPSETVSRSSTSKRPFFYDSNNGDQDSEGEFPRKNRRVLSNSTGLQKSLLQIPCVVDDCPGKDNHMSESIRKAAKHHSLYVCVRCYLSFSDEVTYQHHRTVGDACQPHCISAGCSSSKGMTDGVPLNERRHRRGTLCPPEKTVSIQCRWQYLYFLQYPERITPDPVFSLGSPHPHGLGQPRPQRRRKVNSSEMFDLQHRLSEAKSELQSFRQQKDHDDKLHEMASKEHEDLVARLENIISALLSMLPSLVPEYLERMIRQDAPNVFWSGLAECTSPNSLIECTNVRQTLSPYQPEVVQSQQNLIQPALLAPPVAVERSRETHMVPNSVLGGERKAFNNDDYLEIFLTEHNDAIFRELSVNELG